MFRSFLLALFIAVCGAALAQTAHTKSSPDKWLKHVSDIQEKQPHWITPVATVTPRLEQELRFDVNRQVQPNGIPLWNVGGGKGVEFIPIDRVEVIVGVPAYLVHQDPKQHNGFGDENFLLKYRIASANEEHGNYIVSAFLGASVPTGSYKNGLSTAVITPTLAVGKGWGRFDVQSTLGAGMPLHDVALIGHALQSNTAFQYRPIKYVWPEVEVNATHWLDGTKDSKTQTFITPGVALGKFPIHNRIGLTMAAGFQIAASAFHTYNHNAIFSLRMPF